MPPVHGAGRAGAIDAHLESWSDAAILGAIVDNQAAAIAAIRPVIPALATAARHLAQVWRAGGKIGYAGAGSSGMAALMDALELPGTFGMTAARLPVLLAGGAPALDRLDAAAEDNVEAALAAVNDAGIGIGDALIAVSASGSTPYTLAAARQARARGAYIIAIACRGTAPLLEVADLRVPILTGPELVDGSTRMSAGTTQKCALNMLSTLTAIRLNHVYCGTMVNVRVDNLKLHERATGIVARVAQVDTHSARAALLAAGGNVKPAIVVARTGLDAAEAARLVDAADGDVGAVLARLEGPGAGAAP